MSSLSPAAVLFDILGNTLAVYNNTAGVAGQPLLPIAGYDGYANVTRYLLTNGQGSLLSSFSSNNVSVINNGTLTVAGSDIFTANYFGCQQINLIVNVVNAPTGTGTPTLTFTIQEVDPGNGTTTFGNSASTVGITAAGVYTAVLTNTHSSAMKVSWTVTGTTPSFTGVYVTISTKGTPDTQVVSGTVTATNSSVGTDGAAALGFDTQVGGKVTTAAPAYSNGNLNALSLTTLGGLRIDGVYATGTTNAAAADAMVSGGYVTTAAPTYTTGQLNPLSLDTSGNLRVLVGNASLAVTQSTSPWIVAGGGTVGTPASGVVTIQGITGMTPVVVTTNKATTSAFTTVAGATSSTAILAANANRMSASIYNATNKNMYVLCNSGAASLSNYSILLMQGSYWEVPTDYQGAINAIWAAGVSGNANVTEYTP